MHRRLLVGILLLALAWQGPVLAYSAPLAVPMASGAGATYCLGAHLTAGNACDDCCSHSGTCATACTLSLAAVLPTTLSLILAAVQRLPAPNASKPALLESPPARFLRPPIV
jgi:hypothetical protein